MTSDLANDQPAVWFPAIRTGTGTDVFTQRLCDSLIARDVRAEIAWLPHRVEYLPLTVSALSPPDWANVVHVNSWLHPRFIPGNLPVVATVHHVVHDQLAASYKSPFQKMYHHFWIHEIERHVLSRANAVTSVSQFSANQMRQVFGIDDAVVIPNWVDVNMFTPPVERKQNSPFKLLHVGTWSARKGVSVLAPLMRILGAGFELRYTDSNPQGKNVRGLPGNCMCLGRLSNEELVGAMRNSDALVFPSRLEGFGLVAAEAMACGLPVVATRGSSLPEVVKDGITGILCPQDDVAAFAQAIRLLAADPVLWRRISSCAVSHVRTSFSEGPAIDAYFEVYRDVIRSFSEDKS